MNEATEIVLNSGAVLLDNPFWNGLLITVIVGVIAIVITLVVWFIARMKDPHKVKDIASVVKTVLDVSGGFLKAVDKNPDEDNFLEKMQKYSLVAVTSLEQLASWSQELKAMTPDDRRWSLRSQGTNMVKDFMKKAGFDMSDVNDETVGAMIDWAVKYANDHGWFQPEKKKKDLPDNA